MSDAERSATTPPAPAPRRWPLHVKILIGLVVGAALGVAGNLLAARGALDRGLLDGAVAVADPLGRIFLRLILMVVIPLVLSALALGVLELGDVRRLGVVGLKTLLLTLLLSGCAVAIGLTLVN